VGARIGTTRLYAFAVLSHAHAPMPGIEWLGYLF
jgi:hypothetical protein